MTQQKRTRTQDPLWGTALRRQAVKPAVSDHKLWTYLRYKAPGTEVQRKSGRRDDPKQFVARMCYMRWGKCQDTLPTHPATSVREGMILDTGGLRIYVVGCEDVRLAPTVRAEEGVYMPTTPAHF